MDTLIVTPSGGHFAVAVACFAVLLLAGRIERRSAARRDAPPFAGAEAAVAATRQRLAQMRRQHNQRGA